MEANEDEPEDVRNATPVTEEIQKGQIDEDSGNPTRPYESARKRHRCVKETPKKKPKEKSEECCRAKKEKLAKAPKTAKVLVYEKPCVIPRTKAIPRHCLTKKEWIDILATPNKQCPPDCLQKLVTKRIRPVSPRMAELAQPPKHRLMETLEKRAGILPIEFIDKLIQTLEGETCLTPEQAEKLFRDKDNRAKKKCRKKKPKSKCPGGKYETSEPGSSSSPFDKEAVQCQYMIAESFVKSLLEWKSPIPKEEFADIAQVIMRRLSYSLAYNPINGEDRKSQQMRFLSDVIASWISGVLFEVAETKKSELEEECERRKKLKEEEEEDDEDDSDDGDDDDFDDGPEDSGRGPRTDPKKKDDKDDDVDHDKKKKPSHKWGRGSKEDEEKFYDARTSVGSDEKKTSMEKPKQESRDDRDEAREPKKDDKKKESKEPEARIVEPETRKEESGKLPVERKKDIEKPEVDTERSNEPRGRENEEDESKKLDPEDRRKRDIEDGEKRDTFSEDGKKSKSSAEIIVEGNERDKKNVVEDSEALAATRERKNENEVPEIESGVDDKAAGRPEEKKTEKQKAKDDGTSADEKDPSRKDESNETGKKDESKEKGKKDSRAKEKDKQGRKSANEEKTEMSNAKADKTAEGLEPEDKSKPEPISKSEVEGRDDKVERKSEKEKIPDARSEGRIETFEDKKPREEEKIPERKLEEISEDRKETSRKPEETEEIKETSRKPEAEEEIRKETPGQTETKEEIKETSGKPEEKEERKETPGKPEAKEGRKESLKEEKRRQKKESAEAKAAEAAARKSEAKEQEKAQKKIDGEEEAIDARRDSGEKDSPFKLKMKRKSTKDQKSKEESELPIDLPLMPGEKTAEDDLKRRITKVFGGPMEKLKMKFGEFEKKEMDKDPSDLAIGKKFRTDTPFVTFDKIFHTIYNAIEESDENDGSDVIANRIHRAVYEKFSHIVQEEKPGPMSDFTRDVLEVMSGKVALWLRNILTESQINFVNRFPATVESTEIREWTGWISFVSDMAGDWSTWIENTIREMEGLNRQVDTRGITRGHYRDWTKGVDIDALRWRRFYLESLHRGHQNLTMVRNRQVVKAATREIPPYDGEKEETEKEVKITNLENEKRNVD